MREWEVIERDRNILEREYLCISVEVELKNDRHGFEFTVFMRGYLDVFQVIIKVGDRPDS